MAWLYKQPKSPNWSIGLTPTEQKLLGKKNFSTGTADKRAAGVELTKVKKRIKHRKGDPPLQTNNLTFQQAYKLMEQDRKNTKGAYSKLTTAVYSVITGIMEQTFGNKLVHEYQRDDHHYLVNKLDLDHNSKAEYLNKVNAVFNFLVREKYLKENPFKRITKVIKEIFIQPKEHIDKLLDFSYNTEYYWYFEFQIASAFRVSEVLSTTLGKIETDLIRVTRKGNVPNYIPILNIMRDLLNKMPLPSKLEEKLFPFEYHQVRYFFKKFEDKTNIHFHTHDLRKYMISSLANAGVPINFTKDYAGHNDIKTTMLYYYRSEKLKMAENINDKLLYTALYKSQENPQNNPQKPL